MPTLALDIVVVPTYNTMTLGIAHASTYPTTPPSVTGPTIEITPPGFNTAVIAFVPASYSVYTSITLGITTTEVLPLPDGVYNLKYSITPAYSNYVEKSIMRIDRLQERYDEAFMHLDMTECDKAIKTQAKVDLTSIYFFMQGAVSAANNCAIDEANKLYAQASKMLYKFSNKKCGYSNNNYL